MTRTSTRACILWFSDYFIEHCMNTITVTNLDKESREIELQTGMSLMELLREHGYDEISAICGGCCSCATCHVHIEPGSAELDSMDEDEAFVLEDADGYDPARSRLSCQVALHDKHAGLHVQILDND